MKLRVNATHAHPDYVWKDVEVTAHEDGGGWYFTAPGRGCSRTYLTLDGGLREWCRENGASLVEEGCP